MSSDSNITNEQLDAEARSLLDDPRLGPIIRQACAAEPSSRRDRWEAAHALIAIAKRAPLLAEVIGRATGMAWRDRLARVLVDDDLDQSITNVADLLRDLRDSQP